MRINLSELAGALDPDGMDDSIVPAELVEFERQGNGRANGGRGVPYSVMNRARRLGALYERCQQPVKERAITVDFMNVT